MATSATRAYRALPALLLTLAMVVSACSSDPKGDGQAGSPSSPTTVKTPASTIELRPIHVEHAATPYFADDANRQVLLRGVNVIHLGDYYQADPKLQPTLPVTDQDWAAMQALGFDVVRLIVSWSALEPKRGAFDRGYVQRIHRVVDQAKAHGIYVVLDMHQDAWGKSIATPAGYTCPAGLEPAIGWDGAPEWATLTDGAGTCRSGDRESAAAVKAAFTSFYDNRDGIRTALSTTWGRLAAEFADDPTIAGFDLFNEPNIVGDDLAALQVKYGAFLTEAITAIRAGEKKAGGFPHVIFFEPTLLFPVPNNTPPPGFTTDPNIAFSPHNYWESIVDAITVEAGFKYDTDAAAALGVPYWVGEYGWWDTSARSLAALRRYAVAEDHHLVGGAWWEWRQACGDPHSIGSPGNVPDDQTHLNGVRCPDGKDLGLTEQFATVLSRAYPRTAPGALTKLESDSDTGRFHVRGTTGPAASGTAPLVVWVPGTAKPEVGGTNIAEVTVTAVKGGYLIRATAGCDYALDLGSTAVTGDPRNC